MRSSIQHITITGFKSIRSLENFPLGPLSVLIGANGAGKSNFVSFFTLLREMVEQRLALAVNKAGGADTHLFLGPKTTQSIRADIAFGLNRYAFELQPTQDNRLVFADEHIHYVGSDNRFPVDRSLGSGHGESRLKQEADRGTKKAVAGYIYGAISSWVVYHFHDTSETAPLRRFCSVRDYERLRPDAANLAAFLLRLKQTRAPTFELMRDTIRLVAPFFADFRFRPQAVQGDEVVQLEWKQQNSDYPFHPAQFSDGTLRFIALAAALLQPFPPATILIDEPELGLHPVALDTLADLIRQASQRTQVIVSTQSAALLNAFEPEEIVVIDRHEGESKFRRLSKDELTAWVEAEYTLGELWQKNVYGGSPTYE